MEYRIDAELVGNDTENYATGFLRDVIFVFFEEVSCFSTVDGVK